jgi:hypothetical protein
VIALKMIDQLELFKEIRKLRDKTQLGMVDKVPMIEMHLEEWEEQVEP